MKYREDRCVRIIAQIVLITMSLLAVIPFVLLMIASFTDQQWITLNGYSFTPGKLSLDAYEYLWTQRHTILNAYKVTLLLTLVGTLCHVALTTLFAYPISLQKLPGRKFFTFLVFFTMLFNGGLVPTYIWYTNFLGVKNSFLGLLLPSLMMSAWNVLLVKTFFQQNVPMAVLEAARIDGANEWQTFGRIVLPMGKPIIATVGLFAGINYWNDWYNGMIYVTKSEFFSIQSLLNRMMADIQALTTSAQAASNAAGMNIPSTTVRMAIAVIGILPILIIYPFIQNNFVKGIAIGSVK